MYFSLRSKLFLIFCKKNQAPGQGVGLFSSAYHSWCNLFVDAGLSRRCIHTNELKAIINGNIDLLTGAKQTQSALTGLKDIFRNSYLCSRVKNPAKPFK